MRLKFVVMIFTVGSATRDDFEAFDALQNQVLLSKLAPHEREHGFVSTEFSPADLEEVLTLEGTGIWVAKAPDGRLAGWVFGLSWDYCVRRPLFRAMVERFPVPFDDALVDASNSFQWGPVAVAPEFRGMGVLEAMFEGLRRDLAPHWAFGATFISARNGRSLAAHTRKLGMRIVDDWQFDDKPWHTLTFGTQ